MIPIKSRGRVVFYFPAEVRGKKVSLFSKAALGFWGAAFLLLEVCENRQNSKAWCKKVGSYYNGYSKR